MVGSARAILIAAALASVCRAVHPPFDGSFAARILMASGRPAEGASARLYKLDGRGERVEAGTAKADREGWVRFDGLLIGPRERLSIMVVETQDKAIDIVSVFDQPERVVLNPVGTAALRLRMPNGDPAQGVRVAPKLIVMLGGHGGRWLSLDDPAAEARAATTNDRGEAVLRGLPVGAVVQPAVLDERFAQIGHGFRVPVTAISEAATEMRLDHAGSIEGTLRGPASVVGGVRVCIQETRASGGDAAAETITDEKGRFVIKQLPMAVFNLYVGLARPHSDAWTARAREVRVGRGARASGADLRLIKGGLVTGRVVYAGTSDPAVGVSVAAVGPARPQNGALPQTSLTDAKGRFILRLPAGENHVVVQLAPTFSQGQTVLLKDGETKSLYFVCPRPLGSSEG